MYRSDECGNYSWCVPGLLGCNRNYRIAEFFVHHTQESTSLHNVHRRIIIHLPTGPSSCTPACHPFVLSFAPVDSSSGGRTTPLWTFSCWGRRVNEGRTNVDGSDHLTSVLMFYLSQREELMIGWCWNNVEHEKIVYATGLLPNSHASSRNALLLKQQHKLNLPALWRLASIVRTATNAVDCGVMILLIERETIDGSRQRNMA